ncbi:hypothetical protein [Roseateles sp. BYS87W]|uniref:Uncharacterized protein n=1 Tax=Pelomonas baiyunensis TaxID=3299026 RepID=A0ABW7H542_9BURK
MSRADVESFFRTLLLGDFDENQNSAALVVGGLLGLIPVLDQVLDARDITGSLYKINQAGGFKNASTDQVVSFGFAAFGAIPEVGSVFKGVFKPLYKQRKAAKGAVHGGLHALEVMLGMKKGGALTWIRKELIGKWGPRTRDAIATANAALSATIELTEFLATASGWKDWLVPDSIQALARQLLPGLKALRGSLDAPIQRASNEIREFLEDLLGEQAAAVVMAVGQTAAAGSAVPGSRTRNGHNAAAVHSPDRHTSTKTKPTRHGEETVSAKPKVDAKSGSGPVHAVVQATAKATKDLANQQKGLIGEHVADFHELNRLGGNWPHDKSTGSWSPATVKKLNVDKRPVNLSLADLPKVNHAGIDAVWEHAGQYTVTEAKASASIGAVYGMGKFKEKKGLIPVVTGLNQDQQLLHYLLSDSSDKKGTQTALMQMGAAWVQDRAPREGLSAAVTAALRVRNKANYKRHVVLVTLESPGGLAHAEAMIDVSMGKPASELHPHTDHSLTREWEAAAIDAVDAARLNAHEARRAASKPDDAAPKPSRRKNK